MKKNILVLIIITSAITLLSFSSNIDQPIELGKVSWMRNFDEGILKSKKENKPIFLLFQEVPGCSTCHLQ